MSYCSKCQSFVLKEHDTPYGVWMGTCKKLGVGRNPDTWSCDKVDPIVEKGAEETKAL